MKVVQTVVFSHLGLLKLPSIDIVNMKNIFNITLILISVAHIFIIVYYKLNPEVPNVKIYKKQLGDIEFPVVFRICLHDAYHNEKRYKDVGYNDVHDYYLGISRFDKSIRGWAGHYENGSTIGTVEGKLRN